MLSVMFTVLLTSGNAGAQIPAAEPERFEVSSIKRSAPSPVGGGFGAPSLFTALREQLGLALTSGRERLEVVVVDRIEPPTPD